MNGRIRIRWRELAAVTLSVTLLATGGCRLGEDKKGRTAEDVATAFLDALKKGDHKKAKSYWSAAGQQRIARLFKQSLDEHFAEYYRGMVDFQVLQSGLGKEDIEWVRCAVSFADSTTRTNFVILRPVDGMWFIVQDL